MRHHLFPSSERPLPPEGINSAPTDYLVAGIVSRVKGVERAVLPARIRPRDNVSHKFIVKPEVFNRDTTAYYYAVVYLQVILRRSTRWVYTTRG